MQEPICYDVLGIGFGPANMALAAAVEETAGEGGGPAPTLRFLEADPHPLWQGGMILNGSNIQNNPVRDLVTLRNPRSRYTFINYLHEAGRLLEHLNLPQEFPLRKEYARYIEWVRRHFDHLVDYGERVASVTTAEAAGEPVYEVVTGSGVRRRGRALVVGTGRTPYIPEPFASAAAAVPDDRIIHLTEYLPRIGRLTAPPRNVVVIGGSQSAVEITLDLAKRYPQARIQLSMRSFGLRLKDTSPFSEEGFFPRFTDYYYRASRAGKRELDAYMRPTNYSSTDEDVLHELYLLVYEQRLDGDQRVFVTGNQLVTSVTPGTDALTLGVEEVHTGEREEFAADLVVLATGFRDLGPGERQERYPALLGGIAHTFGFDTDGYLGIDPAYRVRTVGDGVPPLFLNGLCETSHGIGDAGSFSLLSLRAAAICERLLKLPRPPVPAGTGAENGAARTSRKDGHDHTG
ncbi:SidA/IucD/PvdA family monooxygenase [Streptomyces sp. CAU 1734]|uniref:SidA/IucD/PvdA family monooxygenase n=1 Tax=Streptomyces sp. CAU 1734 TaxID=3140360 RepID=UPI00325FECA3